MSNNLQDETKWTKWAIGIGVIILCLWGSYVYFVIQYSDKLSQVGQFGDSFGTLNALFSGFAFGGVIITLLIQQRELKIQREVLELHQEELEGQKNALQKETFERTFFQLLTVLEQKYAYAQSKQTTGKYPVRITDIFEWVHKNDEGMIQSYREFIIPLKNYILLLVRVLDFVNKSSFCEEEEKKSYIYLLRDKMSEDELHTLFLFSMNVTFCEQRCPKINIRQPPAPALRDLIEDYELFRNLSKADLVRLGESYEYDYKIQMWPTIEAFGEDHPEAGLLQNMLLEDL